VSVGIADQRGQVSGGNAFQELLDDKAAELASDSGDGNYGDELGIWFDKHAQYRVDAWFRFDTVSRGYHKRGSFCHPVTPQ
jgi:hypothetical protein